MRYVLLILLSIFINIAWAEPLYEKHYKAISMNGMDVYDVAIVSNVIVWRGLEGEEKGLFETNLIQNVFFSDSINIMHWKGKRDSFVTLIVDNKNLKYAYSMISKDKTAIMDQGRLEIMN